MMRLYALLGILLWVSSAVAYIDHNAVRRVEAKNLRYSLKVKDKSIKTVTKLSEEKEAEQAEREETLEAKLAEVTAISARRNADGKARERAMQARIDELQAEGKEITPTICDIPEEPPSCEVSQEILDLLRQ